MKKQIYLPVFLGLILLLLTSSCITNKQKLYLQPAGKGEVKTAMPYQPYRLRVNDEIVYYLMTGNIETQQLYNNNNTSVWSAGNQITYRIYEDGTVNLPTLGKIKILDMTIREAERVLTEQFKNLVVDAEVKISLANNYFYVEGDGGKGRFYVYKEQLNIFQALAMAGDISPAGDKKHVKIIRRGADGFDHITTVDIRKESIISSEFYYIRPNDVIYIPTHPNTFFRIESVSDFFTMAALPLSLALSLLTYFKINKQ